MWYRSARYHLFVIGFVIGVGVALLCGGCQPIAAAQPVATMSVDEQMAVHGGHPNSTLYVAGLSGDQVVPAAETSATGTGAFVLEGEENPSLTYDLTYDGLTTGPAQRIVLRNFGAGGVGEIIHVICDADGSACPTESSGTISGRWTGEDTDPLTPELVREIAVQRVYVEIETAGESGEPAEVRGQLQTNGLMVPVRGFVARLEPLAGVETTEQASGTGAFFRSQFADGTEAFSYQITVTGLSSPLQGAQIVGGRMESPGAEAAPLLMLSPTVLAEDGTGGTLAGMLERGTPRMLPMLESAEAMVGGEMSLIVITEANPQGELIGVVAPLE